MKNLKSILVTLGLLLASSLAFGQTALTFTNLSSAVTSQATFVTLASVTGVTSGTILFIDDGTAGTRQAGEAMQVLNVPSTGTTVQVLRGFDQTIPNGHITGALVLAGPANAFSEIEPNGACTAANTGFTPYVNLKTGNQWLCSTVTNSWVPGWFNIDAQAGVTAAVASAAGAVKPSGPLFHVTGALAITAWGSSTTVGLAGGGGSATDTIGANFCIIPDGAFTTTATNNIALASTAVVNKLLCYVFDQTNKKYVPSY
jgi:hypothetical protein